MILFSTISTFLKNNLVDIQHFTNENLGVIIPKVDLESRDRMFHGTIAIPDGIKNASFSIKNNFDNQSFGSFSLISESGTTAEIYDSEDAIFSESEMTQEDAGTLNLNLMNQDVVIIKDKDNPREFHVYGIFDNIGDIELALNIDGTTITKNHTLYGEEFAEWIDYFSYWVSGGLEPPSLMAMSSAQSSSTTTTTPQILFAAPLAQNNEPIQFRGIVARALLDPFKMQVNVPIALVRGVFNGIIAGVTDDYECGVEIVKFIGSPYKRGSEIYHALKELSLENIEVMIGNAINNLMSEADAAIVWRLSADIGNDVVTRTYVAGFVFGYLTEQVAVMAIGAGIVTKVGKGIKGLIMATKAGKLVLTGISNAKKFALTFLKFASTKVTSIAELEKITAILTKLKSTKLAGYTVKIADVLGDRYQNWAAKVEALRAVVNGAWDTMGEKALTRLAELTRKFGPAITDKLSDKAVEGFFKVYKRVFFAETLTDRFDDVVKIFKKADGTLHKTALDDSLALISESADDLPKLKLKKISEVHEYSYRYWDSERPLNFAPYNGKTVLEYHKVNKTLPLDTQPFNKVRQFTNTKHATPSIAADKLQIKTTGGINERWSDCKVRTKVRTSDLGDEVYMSYSRKAGKENYLEPVLKDHPEYGSGGHLQYQSPTSCDIVELEFWNGISWEKITITE